MTANTRSTNPEASFTTTSREDCAQCIAPELGEKFSFITDSITHCRVGDCGPPVVPANGDVRVFGTSVAVYFCDDGYYLADRSYRVCLDNGAWSGSVPACN
ncbi:Sushi, von Willebrand factor type A, EGF and pentraxin domain-containing protein 1, partial [Geodia barretti]